MARTRHPRSRLEDRPEVVEVERLGEGRVLVERLEGGGVEPQEVVGGDRLVAVRPHAESQIIARVAAPSARLSRVASPNWVHSAVVTVWFLVGLAVVTPTCVAA
jgi:hypothetical protein